MDTTKWTQNVTPWSEHWTWDKDHITFARSTIDTTADVMKLLFEAEEHKSHDQYPNSWTRENQAEGFIGLGGSSNQSAGTTTKFQHTGKASVRLGMYKEEYWSHNVISQVVTVPNGTYNLGFWAWAGGTPTTSQVIISEYDGDNEITKTIYDTGTFVEYRIDNISVTTGELKISIEGKVEPGDFVRLDDFSVTPVGGTTNYVNNPGFENRDTKYYKSAAMRSVSKIKYGYFESRFKTTRAPGVSTAFWLATNSIQDGQRYWSEIDILESGQSDINFIISLENLAQATTHAIYPLPWKHGSLNQITTLPDIDTNFNTYAMEWNEEWVTVYYNGEQGNTHYNSESAGSFTYPMNIIFDAEARGSVRSAPQDWKDLTTTAEIDYVRVWKKKADCE